VIAAPDGFLEHSISENVYAGNAMSRRASFMYGSLLPKSSTGQADAGLGKTISTGTTGLIAPGTIIKAIAPARGKSARSTSSGNSLPVPRRRARARSSGVGNLGGCCGMLRR